MRSTISALAGLLGLLMLAAAAQTETAVIRSPAELQAAIDSARAGQTILLAPGATFVGHFVLPPWTGGDTRPIVIRTAGSDAVAAGTRMAPARAVQLAKLKSPDGRPALATSPGTRFWRIELLEFLPSGDASNEIIALGSADTDQRDTTLVAADLTLDRLYIHGDPERGQKRGIALNSSRTTITNSFLAEFKAVGADSQAIAGWNGPGEYLIENNYLEAAGENLLFGGGDPRIPGLTPTAIVIRGNTLSRPVAWRTSTPRWDVKNILELKNARNVRIENNLLEHNWAGAQNGYSILFTVRNQEGGCSWCQVEDVTFENNVVRDVAAGISILGEDYLYPSRRTNNITISRNLFVGLDSRAWGGDGFFVQMTHRPQGVTLDHNTIIQGASGGMVKIEGVVDAFSMTNNIMAHGEYGIIASDHAPGADTIRATLPGARITANVMAGGNEDAYPPGNLFPSLTEFLQQFVNTQLGDYRVRTASTWIRASTTGGPLGAQLMSNGARP